MTPRPIAILGAGNVATALAALLSTHERPVHLYSIEDDVTREINRFHRNSTYLPDISLPETVRAFGTVAEVVHRADAVFLAVPSHALVEVLTLAIPFLHPSAVIGSITKGLDPDCLQPIALTAAQFLPPAQAATLCVIGGPAIATELAHQEPAALLVAGKDTRSSRRIAKLLATDRVKVATSSDPLGVGYCMALKNSYAILLGLCDGLRYPMNSKALVVSLAIEELSRILLAAGADVRTASGLAGVGDLIVTGFSPHGRNRTYGERLVGSSSKNPARLGITTVEGIASTLSGIKLTRRLRVRAPLLETVAKCLSATHHFERPFVEYLNHLTLH